jgi:hypothetical protein
MNTDYSQKNTVGLLVNYRLYKSEIVWIENMMQKRHDEWDKADLENYQAKVAAIRAELIARGIDPEE